MFSCIPGTISGRSCTAPPFALPVTTFSYLENQITSSMSSFGPTPQKKPEPWSLTTWQRPSFGCPQALVPARHPPARTFDCIPHQRCPSRGWHHSVGQTPTFLGHQRQHYSPERTQPAVVCLRGFMVPPGDCSLQFSDQDSTCVEHHARYEHWEYSD